MHSCGLLMMRWLHDCIPGCGRPGQHLQGAAALPRGGGCQQFCSTRPQGCQQGALTLAMGGFHEHWLCPLWHVACMPQYALPRSRLVPMSQRSHKHWSSMLSTPQHPQVPSKACGTVFDPESCAPNGCAAGDGPLLELLQRGPGRASCVRLPQPAREAALGGPQPAHQPGLVRLLLLHHRLVLPRASCAQQGHPQGDPSAQPALLSPPVQL